MDLDEIKQTKNQDEVIPLPDAYEAKQKWANLLPITLNLVNEETKEGVNYMNVNTGEQFFKNNSVDGTGKTIKQTS